MRNKRNIVTFLYLILSYMVLVHLKKTKQEKAPELKESEESKNATTKLDTSKSTETTITQDDEEQELKDQDWDVWCKLQPNSNDCSGRDARRTRFYYDIVLEDCKTFLYGQCSSSFNNFATLTECHDSCREPGAHPLRGRNYTAKILCRLQPSFGNGFEYHPMYYFDINKRKCTGFSFSGMGGNGHRFDNAQICSSICLRALDTELTF